MVLELRSDTPQSKKLLSKVLRSLLVYIDYCVPCSGRATILCVHDGPLRVALLHSGEREWDWRGRGGKGKEYRRVLGQRRMG